MKRRKLRIANKFRFSIFIIIVSLVIISGVGTLIGLNTVESASIPKYIEVYVDSGDTLWDIAQEYGPDHVDTRKTIYEISKLNQLNQDYIYPGQVLRIPTYSMD